MTESFQDVALPFQLETSALRGRLVRLGPALQTILSQHAYPDEVSALLGETTALAVALGSALKRAGVFTLQVKGDGPVRLLIADMAKEGGVRAYAQFDAAALGDGAGRALLGAGHLAFTAFMPAHDGTVSDEDRYQGIVALEGDDLSAAVQSYFRRSEQIPTGIMAACVRGAAGWCAGALLLQRMPSEGGIQSPSGGAISVEDDWLRAMSLMQTLTPEELTDPALPLETILYRLFHEEGVRVYDGLPLAHACRCSAERVEGMIRSLPEEELPGLMVDGAVSVTCQFCSKSYRFDEAAVKALRAADAS